MDIADSAAGLVNGTMAAQAVDPENGHAGEAHHNCADCGAVVTGKYCSQCGQAAHVHRTLSHLWHELLHGVMHFDGRIWRTLPLLLVNPGKLTREWSQGRRTRYVSPLAIFLFTLFLLFFGLSFAPNNPMSVKVEEADSVAASQSAEQMQATLVDLKSSVAEIDAELPTATGAEKMALGAQKTALAKSIDTIETRLAAAEGNSRKATLSLGEKRTDNLESGSWQAQVADLNWDSTNSSFLAKVGKKLKNPDFAVYKLQQTAYKFSFLLIPLSIPFMWLLLAWRKGFTLYDHGVFVLYSLTFMAMMTMVAAVLVALIPSIAGLIGWAVMLIVPAHLFAQLKGAYSLSIFSTLWRTILLLVFCALVITMFLAVIVYLGLGH